MKSADLRLHLFERSVHPELFDTLRRIDLEERGVRASLVISGQSHVLTVRSGGETLTEVVAPVGLALPRMGVHSVVQLGRGARDEVRRESGAVRYAASILVESYAPAEYAQMTSRLLARDSFERLKAFFEPAAGGGPGAGAAETTPFALMDFARTAAGLEVLSVHACPHELTIVRVESRIAVR